jgi:hypothetical protein
MHFKNLIIFVIMLLLATFIVPNVRADNSCINCHQNLTAFNETEQQFNNIRLQHLSRGVSCSLECHTNTLEKFATNNYLQWSKSKHALFNVTCNNCHGGDPSSDIKEKAHVGVRLSSDINSTIFYRNLPETCGKCHTDELNQFKQSLHYERLKALEQAPSCDTCHRPHEFNILNVSEFHDVCNNCHNPAMNIAPDVPEKAITALEAAQNLKNETLKANEAIKYAIQQGKDMSVAQKSLDSAITIQNHLPILWHSFNLQNFENVTNSGIKAAQQAQLDAGLSLPVSKTSGFGAILSIVVIIAIYGVLHKHKR